MDIKFEKAELVEKIYGSKEIMEWSMEEMLWWVSIVVIRSWCRLAFRVGSQRWKDGHIICLSARWIDNEDLPIVETYDIILNSNDEAICIIQTTKVYVVPFGEVTDDHAMKEGDKSLDFWRGVHRKFFIMRMNEVAKQFNKEMKVVCEEFHVVFKW